MTTYTDNWPNGYSDGALITQDVKWSHGGPNAGEYMTISAASAALVLGSGSVSVSAYYNAGSGWTASQWCEITVGNAISGSVQEGPLCCLASAGASCSYYFVQAKAAQWQFRVVNAGSESAANSHVAVNYTPAANDVLALEVVAGSPNTLNFYQKGTLLGSITDTTITPSSNQPPGIHQYAGSSGHGDITAWRGGTGAYPGLGATPAVTNVSVTPMYNGETGIVITGTGFGASQTGSCAVTIGTSSSVQATGAVTQTITAWADTSITITGVRGALNYGTNVYLYVLNSAGTPNVTGSTVQFYPTAVLTQTLIKLDGTNQASVTSITGMIYKTLPTSATAPDLVSTSLSTNGSGVLTWDITAAGVTNGSTVWMYLGKDAATPLGTGIRLTPTFS